MENGMKMFFDLAFDGSLTDLRRFGRNDPEESGFPPKVWRIMGR